MQRKSVMSSKDEELLSRLKVLAEKNFPRFQSQLPPVEQVYVIHTNEGLSVVVKLSNKGISIDRGDFPNPISTLTMSSSDLDLMLRGELDGVKAFLSGRIKIQGDIFKTMALNNLLRGS